MAGLVFEGTPEVAQQSREAPHINFKRSSPRGQASTVCRHKITPHSWELQTWMRERRAPSVGTCNSARPTRGRSAHGTCGRDTINTPPSSKGGAHRLEPRVRICVRMDALIHILGRISKNDTCHILGRIFVTHVGESGRTGPPRHILGRIFVTDPSAPSISDTGCGRFRF